MKQYKNILSVLLLSVLIACTNSTGSDLVRPSDVPNGVPPKWTQWHQDAYESGRMSFNDDSTVMVIVSERPNKNIESKDFKIDKGLIK